MIPSFLLTIMRLWVVNSFSNRVSPPSRAPSRDMMAMVSMLRLPSFRNFGNANVLDRPEENTGNRLPWSKSIDPNRELAYMPMLRMQLELMKSMGFQEEQIDEQFVYRTSAVKPARIGNIAFKNDKFRKVRMTYFDAGDNVQVFNSLWYPSFEYDIPLLGMDLISLGKGRILSVIDFQPLHPTAEYSGKYISHLTPTRNKYPDLQGTLSGKIYDDTSFFSKNMLFGRFTDESKLTPVVLPAFTDYLREYVALMDRAVPDHRPESMAVVKQRQTAYDEYSALKDPAVGLFDAYFGKEWSASFVHDFLFSFSQHPQDTHVAAAAATGGGGTAKPVHSLKIDANTGAVSPASGGGHPHAHTPSEA